jgi:hypothetical protein
MLEAHNKYLPCDKDSFHGHDIPRFGTHDTYPHT